MRGSEPAPAGLQYELRPPILHVASDIDDARPFFDPYEARQEGREDPALSSLRRDDESGSRSASRERRREPQREPPASTRLSASSA
jgi:hypothetical protein